LVEAVRAPDRERVGGVAARDEDHVVVEREPPQVQRRPGKEVQVRRLGLPLDTLVPGECRRRILAGGGWNEKQSPPAGEP
jgi:hypothetical protein